MPNFEIFQHPVHTDRFLIVEKDGTKTEACEIEGWGFCLTQRRADGTKGVFRGYSDQGLQLFPHLLRFCFATNSRMPSIPKPTRRGLDSDAHVAHAFAEEVGMTTYPFSYEEGGWGLPPGETHSIRTVQNKQSNAHGLLATDFNHAPVFLSPALIRSLLRIIPQIYPHIQSYKIMEKAFQQMNKEKKIRKLVFEKWEPRQSVEAPPRAPLRARKGMKTVLHRYERILRRH